MENIRGRRGEEEEQFSEEESRRRMKNWRVDEDDPGEREKEEKIIKNSAQKTEKRRGRRGEDDELFIEE